MKTIAILVLVAVAVQAAPQTSVHDLTHLSHNIPTLQPLDNKHLNASHGSKIFNGATASKGQFKHMAAISLDNRAFCGGSLIHPNWVLTAAHCTSEISTFSVTLGANDLSGNEAGRTVVTTGLRLQHDRYGSNGLQFDISLIYFTNAVQLNEFIEPVRLVGRSEQGNTFEGQTARASGWGKTDDNSGVSNSLQFVDLRVISVAECQSIYGGGVTSDVICTAVDNGHSVCSGDSGSPLGAIDGSYRQIGVTSFASAGGCAGAPSGFTRVSSYLDWIQAATGLNPQ